MLSSQNNKARSEFLFGLIAALVLGVCGDLHAQSPLTVQPSTSHVGVSGCFSP